MLHVYSTLKSSCFTKITAQNSLFAFPLIKLYCSTGFYAPTWKVRRGHLVFGSSVRLSVRLFVIPSRLHIKCNNWSFGGDTVTKLGLHLRVTTPHWYHIPLGMGRGQNLGLRDFAIFWLCCHRGHPCFTNTCLVSFYVLRTNFKSHKSKHFGITVILYKIPPFHMHLLLDIAHDDIDHSACFYMYYEQKKSITLPQMCVCVWGGVIIYCWQCMKCIRRLYRNSSSEMLIILIKLQGPTSPIPTTVV